MHLLKITYLKECLIITSICELENKDSNQIPEDKIIHGQKREFFCKWFSEKEADEINENEIVPGIKELIPKALELYDFNQ